MTKENATRLYETINSKKTLSKDDVAYKETYERKYGTIKKVVEVPKETTEVKKSAKKPKGE